MPRPLLALTLLSFLSGSSLTGQQALPTDRLPLFRHVVLAQDSIWLGRPIGPLGRYALHPDDTVVTVPTVEFLGADAIEIHRDSMGIVTSIWFLYGPRYDLATNRERYVEVLGPPARVTTDSLAGVPRRVWIWLDDDTEFRFDVYEVPVEGTIGAVVMIDRRRRGR